MGTFERTVDFLADRYNYMRKAFSPKKQSAPRHIRSDVPSVQLTQSFANLFDNEEDVQKAMSIVSWIYADIELLSRNTWAADFSIRKRAPSGQLVEQPEHPFTKIYDNPNPFMNRSFMIQYLLGWLFTSDRGAFAYLAPNENNPSELMEIWPINPNQIEPVKGNGYVQKWIYFPRGKEDKPFFIENENILWIRYADKFDYWKSFPPLKAAITSGMIEMGIEKTQDKLFNDSRGLPLTLVSLDASLSEPDFESAKETIRKDWEQEGSTIAVTRAGQIMTQSIGFTQSELQTMVALNITRDKIDSIFFGWPIRSEAFSSGEGLKEMDKIVKEQTYRPLFILLQSYIQCQIIDRFYPEDEVLARYEDPRTYDRALNIQEAMIYSRWRTINEMRKLNGEPDMEDPEGMDGYGDLPVQLATNSSFVASLYGINDTPEVDDDAKPQEVGNLEDVQDPESLTNQMARGDEPPTGSELSVKSEAEKLGVETELKRWKTVVKRELRKRGFATGREFDTSVLPDTMVSEIKSALDYTLTEEQADELFDKWLEHLR